MHVEKPAPDILQAGFMDEALLASLGLDELLPAALAEWRPLLLDGMCFFLERLPARRLTAIVADQLALPADASPARRLVALFGQCPTLHKLGQVLARHRGLHPELRRHLQALESMPPETPMEPLLARIRREIGDDASVAVAPTALAEGSVAVVVPFTYRSGGRLGHGVFKVLKPGIEARLGEELAVFEELAGFLEERGRQRGLPDLDYRDKLQSVQRLLTQEIRLEVEQGNLEAAAALYADEPLVRVPRLLPWCTPRLTAMERIFGSKATDAVLPESQRQALADALVSALLAKPFWARSDPAVFHADLHAGNLLVDTEGRLAVLDWSLTAPLSKASREALVAIVLGGLTLDRDQICLAVADLGVLAADDPALAAVVERALDRLVLEGRPPGFGWLLAMLDDLALRRGAGFSEEFALFRKSWLSLSGVIADLAGERSPDPPLLAAGLREFLAEAPARLLAPPHAHDFSTHVSNADLLQVGASSWLAAARYWSRLMAAALRR